MFNEKRVSLERKVAIVNSYCHEVEVVYATQSFVSKGLGSYRKEWIGWNKPPIGWLKPNVDGSFHIGTGISGAGGVLRNDSGEWEDDFTIGFGCSSIEEAES